MKTIFSRHGNVARFGENGNVEINIPSNISVLSLCHGRTNYYNGDDFTQEEHFIVNRVTGKRRKKMHILPDHKIMVWTKTICPSNLARIEDRYIQMRERLNPQRQILFKEIVVNLKKVGMAHVVPERHLEKKHNKYVEEIWEYNYSQIEGEDSFGFNWVPYPEKLQHEAIGKIIYENERLIKQINNRLYKFRNAFLECCKAYIDTHADFSKYHPPLFFLTINDREYVFQEIRHELSLIDMQRLPEINL